MYKTHILENTLLQKRTHKQYYMDMKWYGNVKYKKNREITVTSRLEAKIQNTKLITLCNY